ncbi:MAG TPA: putative baseplate assembly protein [Trichormus sp. M33_DOE_039]|nr:putative baseplate assembly protein [Trichormus sp. M33_DOE_039]
MTTQYFCQNLRRRAVVRDTQRSDGTPKLNGLDYLEVVNADQTILAVHFIHSAPPLGRDNFAIVGGVRVRNIRVIGVEAIADAPQVLQITVNQRGDFSTYTLKLVQSPVDDGLPSGFTPPLDAQLAAIPFSFKANCPSDFDCPQPPDCPPAQFPTPQIDYLAKDYASFRRLMLDRLAITLPEWQTRNPADVGIAIVEVLAYAADHLSYYQDAAATEAMFNKARQRPSVKRHGRLLNYFMHEGCNARTWIQVQSEVDNLVIPPSTQFLTRVSGQASQISDALVYQETLQQQPAIFEAMHSLHTYIGHNEIQFYAWSDENCCLPKGATQATLQDDFTHRLHLVPGDVLVLEERLGAETGRIEDADITRRWAVRLTDVHPAAEITADGTRIPTVAPRDPLTEVPIVEIRWREEDALPFTLCLSKVIDGQLQQSMSVARGNILLADHGQTLTQQQPIPAQVPEGRRYRPSLAEPNITYRIPYNAFVDSQRPASSLIQQDPRQALPAVTLQSNTGEVWQPRRDLLNSDRFDPGFVVEMNSDRTAYLRFGDNIFGQRPAAFTWLQATYRVGNGRAGNIGAEAIAHIVTTLTGIITVSNRLPGIGGSDPEAMQRVKLDAPQAFRVQQRAVTAEDYARVAERHPEVQKAVATRRWTGSWYTIFITVDRKGGKSVDAQFEQELRQFLEKYRMAGYDLEIDAPRFVPLDILFSVCVKPGYFANDVKAVLLQAFSNQDLVNGQRGFFHPDNFTFGQPVYLSQVIATAMAIPGVQWVDVSNQPSKRHRFQRWGQTANGELASGEIQFGRWEIARLDNDPNAPENGRIDFLVEGGQ